jgi:predicted GTPase
MCPNGDVEYLILLDTEGLNSPERQDKEYDRKIVLFTLMCSDFLIVNSRGDMTPAMTDILKMCTVQYDKLKAVVTLPKILYTFVANNDLNETPFKI